MEGGREGGRVARKDGIRFLIQMGGASLFESITKGKPTSSSRGIRTFKSAPPPQKLIIGKFGIIRLSTSLFLVHAYSEYDFPTLSCAGLAIEMVIWRLYSKIDWAFS